MSFVTVGQSFHPVAYKAGCEAVQRAVSEYMAHYSAIPRGINLAIISASPGYAQESLLRGIRHTLGDKTPIVGCSSAKQFTRAGMSSNSVTVMLVWADSRISAKPIIVKSGRNSIAATVRHLVREVRDRNSQPAHTPVRLAQANGQIFVVRPYTLVLFGAGPSGEFLALVDQVSQALGPAFQVIGSVAEGCPESPSGYQYFCGQPHQDSIVGFLLTNRAPSAIGWCDGRTPSTPEHILHLDEKWDQPLARTNTTQMAKTFLNHAYQELDKEKERADMPARRPPASQFTSDMRQSHHRVPSTTIVADFCRSVNGLFRHSARQSFDDVPFSSPHTITDLQTPALETAVEHKGPVQLCRHICDVHHNARQALARLGNARPASAILLVASDRLERFGETSMALELLSIREAIGSDVPLFGFTTAGPIAASHPSLTVARAQSSILYLIGA